jgi:hypothetical protein
MRERCEKSVWRAWCVSSKAQIATRLLAELEDERPWKVRFESTTNEQWDRLPQMVRQEIVGGDTTPLDELFPPEQ